MATKKNTIVIVDDHAIMRDGLKTLITASGEYTVIDTAADGREAIESARRQAPDLILMDIAMPRTNGVDAIRTIKRINPDIKIVALTFYNETRYIHAALKAGADAYVLKDDSREELFTALDRVLSGQNYLSPSIASQIVSGVIAETSEHESSWDTLTQREQQVLKLIAEGNKTKEIATFLSLSPKTIEKHRANMMKKLDLHNVSAVTKYALQHDLVS